MAGNVAARASWMVALRAAAAGMPREPPKRKWKALIKKVTISNGLIIAYCGICSIALAFIEGDQLAQEGRYFFEKSELPLSNYYARWLASMYIITTTVTTVGYGDVVPFTAGGKWFVMFCCTIGFVADIVCIIRVSELTSACMCYTTYHIFKKKGKAPHWFNPAVLLTALILLAVSNAIFWMMLTQLNPPDSAFLPWTFTDSCWFSWATFTTVGFGDFSPASSGQLCLTLVVAYLFVALFGLGLMTSLIESVVEYIIITRSIRAANRQSQTGDEKPPTSWGCFRIPSLTWNGRRPNALLRDLMCMPSRPSSAQVVPESSPPGPTKNRPSGNESLPDQLQVSWNDTDLQASLTSNHDPTAVMASWTATTSNNGMPYWTDSTKPVKSAWG